jgi:hypothetical protein
MWLPLVCLLGLICATGICIAGSPTALRFVLLAATSVAWLLTNGPVEGATLIHLAPDHGVTVADLAVVVAWLLVVSARVWPGWATVDSTSP